MWQGGQEQARPTVSPANAKKGSEKHHPVDPGKEPREPHPRICHSATFHFYSSLRFAGAWLPLQLPSHRFLDDFPPEHADSKRARSWLPGGSSKLRGHEEGHEIAKLRRPSARLPASEYQQTPPDMGGKHSGCNIPLVSRLTTNTTNCQHHVPHIPLGWHHLIYPTSL